MTARTRAQLNADANTYLADNASGAISAADVRQRIKDLADSVWMPGDALIMKTSGSPAPTTEGEAWWDTDDDVLVFGDGSGQKRFHPQLTGAWTPTISFNGSSAGVVYGTQDGAWIKQGRLCYIEGHLSISNNGTGVGAAAIGGLPFAANQAWGQIGFSYWAGTSGIVGCLYGAIFPTLLQLRHGGATGSAVCTDTNITNSADLYFSGCYLTSS